VGFEDRALRSFAVRSASLTLRDWVGGRRWVLLFGWAGGMREAARSRDGRVGGSPLVLVVFWGVTQNM
jgi:hypothetical protein